MTYLTIYFCVPMYNNFYYIKKNLKASDMSVENYWPK